jgi:crotonobetainyl-CoA:carnitine CoA-transferase CaiB-like acyl-CoA transferase
MSSLLDGIRVIESASLLNGDRLGVLLGDLGADVIKVERPFRGDYLRDFLGQITPHHSPAHVQVNKQKRSVTLDLRQERGREVFWRLLSTADVFVDGNAADAAEKLGISFEEQRAHKPDIVFCQCSGYGSSGPYAPIPTHGQMMSALAGALPVRMGEDGLVRLNEERPRLYPMGGGDGTATAAVYAACYVSAALVRRARTGEGCFIDVSAAEAVMHGNWLGITNHVNADRITDRSTMPVTGGGDGAKYQFYETKDHKFLLFFRSTSPQARRTYAGSCSSSSRVGRSPSGRTWRGSTTSPWARSSTTPAACAPTRTCPIGGSSSRVSTRTPAPSPTCAKPPSCTRTRTRCAIRRRCSANTPNPS